MVRAERELGLSTQVKFGKLIAGGHDQLLTKTVISKVLYSYT